MLSGFGSGFGGQSAVNPNQSIELTPTPDLDSERF
jgi:hypothetical protein